MDTHFNRRASPLRDKTGCMEPDCPTLSDRTGLTTGTWRSQHAHTVADVLAGVGAPPPPRGTPARANILTPPVPKGGPGTAPLGVLAVRRLHHMARAATRLPDAAYSVARPLGQALPWPCRGLARILLLFLHNNRFRHRADNPQTR